MQELVEEIEIRILDALPPEEGLCPKLRYLARDTELETETLRGFLRTLRKKGDVAFWRGLMTEDGAMFGAGYGITQRGLDRLRKRDEAKAAE